jgi:hypothetical protein
VGLPNGGPSVASRVGARENNGLPYGGPVTSAFSGPRTDEGLSYLGPSFASALPRTVEGLSLGPYVASALPRTDEGLSFLGPSVASALLGTSAFGGPHDDEGLPSGSPSEASALPWPDHLSATPPLVISHGVLRGATSGTAPHPQALASSSRALVRSPVSGPKRRRDERGSTRILSFTGVDLNHRDPEAGDSST